MVKALSFFKRRAGMPVEEFQAYWRTRHPDVVTKVPGVRRYVQSHTRPAAYRSGEPVYDGIAEVWFDDSAAPRAATTTPEWDRAQADDGNFIAPGPVAFIVTTEHVIVA
ncbi:MAG: EthD family reductase [Candidatus Rokuibacteriota bacterium]|nr:MAG: EthD family reductase [Candidatus Rokubacteria bacterium]